MIGSQAPFTRAFFGFALPPIAGALLFLPDLFVVPFSTGGGVETGAGVEEVVDAPETAYRNKTLVKFCQTKTK
jgi:hypothetical protein